MKARKSDKKYVVWIDKDVSQINVYAERFKIPSIAEVIPFTDFSLALEYIKADKERTDLIVSNYCTFYWLDNLKTSESTGLLSSVFEFYQDVFKYNSEIPLILFSSIADLDYRLEMFQRIKNFYYINKNDYDLFQNKAFSLLGANRNEKLRFR